VSLFSWLWPILEADGHLCALALHVSSADPLETFDAKLSSLFLKRHSSSSVDPLISFLLTFFSAIPPLLLFFQLVSLPTLALLLFPPCALQASTRQRQRKDTVRRLAMNHNIAHARPFNLWRTYATYIYTYIYILRASIDMTRERAHSPTNTLTLTHVDAACAHNTYIHIYNT